MLQIGEGKGVALGKSFGRKFSLVFFCLLAKISVWGFL